MSGDDFFPDIPGSPHSFLWISGRHYNGGKPPDTIQFNGKDLPNPTKMFMHKLSFGSKQRRWFLNSFSPSTARWKIWGHSFGTMEVLKRLSEPARNWEAWPKDAGYAVVDNRLFRDKDEITDFIQNQKITALNVVSGDRHAFHAGLASQSCCRRSTEPLG